MFFMSYFIYSGSKKLGDFFLGIIHLCVSEGANKDLRGTGAELQILESPTGLELTDIFLLFIHYSWANTAPSPFNSVKTQQFSCLEVKNMRK